MVDYGKVFTRSGIEVQASSVMPASSAENESKSDLPCGSGGISDDP